MNSSTAEESHRVLAIGFVLGCVLSSQDSTFTLKSLVNLFLVPLYVLASSGFLLYLFYQQWESDDVDLGLSRLKRCVSGRGFDTGGTADQSRGDASISAAAPTTVGIDVDRRTVPLTDGVSPVDLTGSYKLVKNEGFDAFLAAQGVPWALRRAVDKAQPVHHLSHAGNELTIKITGIITSESKFQIGGPPVETQIRGRVFLDTVTYLESGDGIRVHKDNRKDRYKIVVTRQLTPESTHMIMTSRAIFDDDEKESVEAKQTFVRI